jgi:dephospho-CoA kinase
VAACLAGLGFAVHSLSDIVREEAADRGLPPEREHLIRVGNLLRSAGGPGVLASRMLGRLGRRDVVDSIRNPAEVEVLRGLPRFVLVGIDAPPELRFRRSTARARPGDPASIEEFRRREEQENTGDPTAQRLAATFSLADRVLRNEAGLDVLRGQVVRLVEELDTVPG